MTAKEKADDKTGPDENAQSAAVAEAAAKPVIFEYDGQTYEVSTDYPESVQFFEHVEAGNYTLMIKEAVGPRQWAMFKAKPRKREQVLEFANAWSDAAGLGK
jgi:hypothetical protein